MAFGDPPRSRRSDVAPPPSSSEEDLQPAETFALATSAERTQIIVDRSGRDSEDGVLSLLEQVQIRLMERRRDVAASSSSSSSSADLAPLYEEANRLVKTMQSAAWRNSTRAQQMQLRHDLLQLDRPSGSGVDSVGIRDRLQRRLGLGAFSRHAQQQQPQPHTNSQDDAMPMIDARPSVLDARELSLPTLLSRSLAESESSLHQFTQAAWEWIAAQPLSRTQLHQFMHTVSQPIISNIVDLVVRELSEPLPRPSSQPAHVQFGDSPLHRALTFDQLRQIHERKPDLWTTSSRFVAAWLLKDRPFSRLSEWEDSSSAGGLTDERKRAYLSHLWQIAEGLATVHIDIKGVVMFTVLWYDMHLFNTVDVGRLTSYVSLPRLRATGQQTSVWKAETERFGVDQSRVFRMENAQIVAPDLHSPGSIFTRCTPAAELALFEFALSRDLDQARQLVRRDAPTPTGWIAYLLPEWVVRTAGAALLRSPEAVSLLSAADLDALKSRLGTTTIAEMQAAVRIEFGSRDPSYRPQRQLNSASPVLVRVLVKNVPTLVVRIFHVHARNFYTKRQCEIDAGNVDLDGLTPKEEHTYEYRRDEVGWSEFLLYERVVDLASLSAERRGVFVVELLGGGYRARAIIRKGALIAIESRTAHGHVFRLMDEETATAVPGSIFLNGQTYRSDDQTGFILIPYAATTTREETIVLMSNQLPSHAGGRDESATAVAAPDGPTFASLAHFDHLSEEYQFTCDFFVDRESLLAKTSATLVMRARLTIHGHDVSLSHHLKQVRLRIDTIDVDGVPSTQIVEPFQIGVDAESTHVFSVPDGLAHLTCALTGEVLLQSTGVSQSVSASHQIELNAHDATNFIEDLYLQCGDDGPITKGRTGDDAADAATAVRGALSYSLLCLGKTGEPIRHRRVQLTLRHAHLSKPLQQLDFLDLATDEDGRIRLGALEHVTHLSATPIGVATATTPMNHHWAIRSNQSMAAMSCAHTHGADIVVQRGERITLPLVGPSLPRDAANDVRHFVLIEDLGSSQLGRILNSAHVRLTDLDAHTQSVALVDLPAGHFVFVVKSEKWIGGAWGSWCVHVVDGPRVIDDYLLDAREKQAIHTNRLDATDRLQVVHTERHADDVVVQLAGCTASTRVHVVATHFHPESTLASALTARSPPSSSGRRSQPYARATSSYHKQKLLGDETNYILRRQLDGGRIGNSLPRPSLLMHERVVQSTHFRDEPTMHAGEAYSSEEEAAAAVADELDGGVHVARKSAVGFAPRMAFGGCPPPAAAPISMARYGMFGGHARNRLDDGSAEVGIDPYDGDSPDRRHTFEFLSRPSTTLTNLRPDANTQTVRIPMSALSDSHRYLSIVAIDSSGQVSASGFGLPLASSSHEVESPSGALTLDRAYRDMRLAPALDSTKHFSEHHLITCLQGGDELVVADANSATVEWYDSLSDFAQLLRTTARNAHQSAVVDLMTRFEWVMQWPTLSSDDQESKYSEFGCHELHLFLAEKDPSFFARVVRPILACKMQKTFVDRYLLGEELIDFMQPRQLSVLNTAERILLARRLHESNSAESQSAAVALLQLIICTAAASSKYSPEAEVAFFRTALQSKSLDAANAANSTDSGSGSGPGAAAVGGDRRKRAVMKSRATEEPAVHVMTSEGSFGFGSASSSSSSSNSPDALVRFSFGSAPPQQQATPQVMGMMAPLTASFGAAAAAQGAGSFTSFASSLDSGAVQPARRLFQAPPTTKEIEERNYYDVSSNSVSPVSGFAPATTLVTPNRFWSDYAQFLIAKWSSSSSSSSFLTRHLGEPLVSFTDAMVRLSVIDLPLVDRRCPPRVIGSREQSMQLVAATPVIVFHREMKQISSASPAADTDETTTRRTTHESPDTSSRVSSSSPSSSSTSLIHASCHFFDPFDLFEVPAVVDSSDEEDRVDKQVSEFLPCKLYGARVVLTNVTSRQQRVDVLLQIPEGSLPVGSFRRRGVPTATKFVEIGAYASSVLTYLFYFPATGRYPHYPVAVTKKGAPVGFGSPRVLHVVSRLTRVATNLRDWRQLSQTGTDEEVMHFLRTENLVPVDLSLICWRFCRGGAVATNSSARQFHSDVVSVLRARLIFHESVWSFALLFDDRASIAELMQQSRRITDDVGDYFISGTVQKDISEYEWSEYRHLEYSPIINARAHTLRTGGSDAVSSEEKKQLRIQNVQFSRQYRSFLSYLSKRTSGRDRLTDEHQIALIYYLLLQDRVDEAKRRFEQIPITDGRGATDTTGGETTPASAACAMQVDYLRCYFAFFTSDPSSCLPLVRRYTSHPFARKRKLFVELETRLMELSSFVDPVETADAHSQDSSLARDELDRTREMANLAATEPTIDFTFASPSRLAVSHANCDAIEVRFYRMNVELMFSAAPFMTRDGADAEAAPSRLFVTPNHTMRFEHLTRTTSGRTVPTAAPSTMSVDIPDEFLSANCWIEVTDGADGGVAVVRPSFAHQMDVHVASKYTYFKVYCQPLDGTAATFYKDGYTDLLGRADFASLSTDRLKSVRQFSILLLHPQKGAVVKLAQPPQQ